MPNVAITPDWVLADASDFTRLTPLPEKVTPLAEWEVDEGFVARGPFYVKFGRREGIFWNLSFKDADKEIRAMDPPDRGLSYRVKGKVVPDGDGFSCVDDATGIHILIRPLSPEDARLVAAGEAKAVKRMTISDIVDAMLAY